MLSWKCGIGPRGSILWVHTPAQVWSPVSPPQRKLHLCLPLFIPTATVLFQANIISNPCGSLLMTVLHSFCFPSKLFFRLKWKIQVYRYTHTRAHARVQWDYVHPYWKPFNGFLVIPPESIPSLQDGLCSFCDLAPDHLSSVVSWPPFLASEFPFLFLTWNLGHLPEKCCHFHPSFCLQQCRAS